MQALIANYMPDNSGQYRRDFLQVAGGSAIFSMAGIASAEPDKVEKGHSPVVELSTDMNSVPSDASIATATTPIPTIVTDKKGVYLPSYGIQDLQLGKPGAIISSPVGLDRVKTDGSLQLDQVPTRGNSKGHGSFLSGGENSLSIDFALNPDRARVSCNQKEVVVRQNKEGEMEVPLSVDYLTLNGDHSSAEIELTLSVKYHGKRKVFGHPTKQLYPINGKRARTAAKAKDRASAQGVSQSKLLSSDTIRREVEKVPQVSGFLVQEREEKYNPEAKKQKGRADNLRNHKGGDSR